MSSVRRLCTVVAVLLTLSSVLLHVHLRSLHYARELLQTRGCHSGSDPQLNAPRSFTPSQLATKCSESPPPDHTPGECRIVAAADTSELLAFVGVQTGPESQDRRSALRSTWFPPTEQSLQTFRARTDIAMRFVLGRKKCEQKKGSRVPCDQQLLVFENELAKEQEQHGEFMRLDMEESYLGLNLKTYLFFRTAIRMYPNAKYFVKADDDRWLFPDRLRLTLGDDVVPTATGMKARSDRSYIGCFKKGPIFKDKNMKWYLQYRLING